MAMLAKVRKITRGPKPVRRLRSLGLQPDLAAEPPTTAGIIAALSGENLAGRRIAIQLYPDNQMWNYSTSEPDDGPITPKQLLAA
jgi:uroporphyrinogen-III synthase